jgi:hypothetical protein
MAAAGFDRAPGGYERTSPSGDRAAVEIRLSATASEDALAFTVVTGLEVATSAEFGHALRPERPDSARLAGVNPKSRTVDWLVAQVRPTPAWASPVAALGELGLHPWSVPVARTDEGMGVFGRLLAEANAPFLAAMLDRPTLLAFLQDPAHHEHSFPWTPEIRAALLLLDDAPRSGDLADRLEDVRRIRGRNHPQFLQWVAARRERASG